MRRESFGRMPMLQHLAQKRFALFWREVGEVAFDLRR